MGGLRLQHHFFAKAAADVTNLNKPVKKQVHSLAIDLDCLEMVRNKNNMLLEFLIRFGRNYFQYIDLSVSMLVGVPGFVLSFHSKCQTLPSQKLGIWCQQLHLFAIMHVHVLLNLEISTTIEVHFNYIPSWLFYKKLAKTCCTSPLIWLISFSQVY